jgi:diguanylate cyclase (GGDEF)-like protein
MLANGTKARDIDARAGQLVSINVIITAFGILLILASLAGFIATGYRSTMGREQERLRTLDLTASSRAQSMLDEIYVTMRLLDEWIRQNPERDPRFDPGFNRFIDVFRSRNGGDADIRLLTETGGLFYFPSHSTKPLTMIDDRDYFHALDGMKGSEVYFGEPIEGRITHKWAIPISYRLSHNDQGYRGFLVMIEFDSFDRKFADLTTGTDYAVLLIRKDKLVLARTPYDQRIVGSILDFSAEDERGYQIVEILSLGRSKRAVSFNALSGYPLYVMVSRDFARIRQGWARAAAIQVAIGMCFLAIFVVLNRKLVSLLKKNAEIQMKLEIAARFDELTGMKNRRYFFERALEEMARARRIPCPMVLLIADIDFFKIVNDTWGHSAGDHVLREIAREIESCVRETDVSGRIGGEEFAVLLVDTDIVGGWGLAERIRESVREVTFQSWQGSISVGVAEWTGDGEPIEQLMRRADMALYRAKEFGRNRVEIDRLRPNDAFPFLLS